MSIQKQRSGKTLTGFDNPNDPVPTLPATQIPIPTPTPIPETIDGTHTFEDPITFNKAITFNSPNPTPFIHAVGTYTPQLGGSGYMVEYYHQDGYYSITGNTIMVFFDIFFISTLLVEDPATELSPMTISLPYPGRFSSITGWLCPKESYWPPLQFPVAVCSSSGDSFVTLYAKPVPPLTEEDPTMEPALPAAGTGHFVGMIHYFISPPPAELPFPPPEEAEFEFTEEDTILDSSSSLASQLTPSVSKDSPTVSFCEMSEPLEL